MKRLITLLFAFICFNGYSQYKVEFLDIKKEPFLLNGEISGFAQNSSDGVYFYNLVRGKAYSESRINVFTLRLDKIEFVKSIDAPIPNSYEKFGINIDDENNLILYAANGELISDIFIHNFSTNKSKYYHYYEVANKNLYPEIDFFKMDRLNVPLNSGSKFKGGFIFPSYNYNDISFSKIPGLIISKNGINNIPNYGLAEFEDGTKFPLRIAGTDLSYSEANNVWANYKLDSKGYDYLVYHNLKTNSQSNYLLNTERYNYRPVFHSAFGGEEYLDIREKFSGTKPGYYFNHVKNGVINTKYFDYSSYRFIGNGIITLEKDGRVWVFDNRDNDLYLVSLDGTFLKINLGEFFHDYNKIFYDQNANVAYLYRSFDFYNARALTKISKNILSELKPIFSYTPTSPQTNQSITFKDESTGSPTTWVWDFGDGTTSNVQNPTKTYFKAGTYTVKLTVSKVGATPVFSTKEIIVVAVSTNAGTLSVVAQSQNAIPVDGGNITLSVTSNIDWQLTSNATWLKPSITGGSGNGTVTLTAENNTLTNDRTAKITFTGKNVASVEIIVNQNKVGLTTATSAPFTLLAKTTSPTTIGLSWEQKGILPSTKFLIEQEQSNGSFKEIGRTTNSLPAYSIDGLTPNNIYCFRVKTLLNQLESLPSNKACATTKINNFKRGVTVVTHGFQLFGNGFSVLSDGKVEDFVMGDSKQVGMCAAIKKRIEDEGGNATIYRNNSNTSKWVKVTGEGKITDEVILFYNWSAVSNDTFDGALEAAADNLFAMLARPKVEGKGGITDNLFDSDLPFHFIAHSRGNIVLLQVLHRMLKYFPNKKIEHFTLLDPHPATTMNDINLKTENQSLPGIYGLPSKYPNEPSLKLPLNVLKADVYYRQVFYYENIKIYDFTNNLTDFSGIPVSNTPNNVLFENNLIENGATPLLGFVFKLAHAGIHEWYKGTIVPNDPIFQQGGRKDWYAVLPRNLYGYNNSRVGNNSNKFTNVSNGIDSTEMNSRIIARTGKSLNPIFNGNFQYVLDGLKSLTKKNALYGYYFNGGKSVETKLISPLSGIQKGKYVLSNPITSSPFVLTHSNFYFPKTYKYLKITVDDFDFNCKLKVDFYNTLDSINSVGGAGIILKEGIKNYYAPIPQSLVGDIGRFTLSSQNKYLISNSLFTDIDISNVELVVGKSPNGGRQITEQQIIIFPNPTMDKITVDLSEIEDNIESIILKDAQGNDIKEIPISIDGKLIQLNLKSYRVGIYYIQVNTSESVITKKIILNQE